MSQSIESATTAGDARRRCCSRNGLSGFSGDGESWGRRG